MLPEKSTFIRLNNKFSRAYFRSFGSRSPGDNRNLSSNSYYDRKFLVFQELVSDDSLVSGLVIVRYR